MSFRYSSNSSTWLVRAAKPSGFAFLRCRTWSDCDDKIMLATEMRRTEGYHLTGISILKYSGSKWFQIWSKWHASNHEILSILRPCSLCFDLCTRSSCPQDQFVGETNRSGKFCSCALLFLLFLFIIAIFIVAESLIYELIPVDSIQYILPFTSYVEGEIVHLRGSSISPSRALIKSSKPSNFTGRSPATTPQEEHISKKRLKSSRCFPLLFHTSSVRKLMETNIKTRAV